ncbi:MAG: OmpA family protein [Chthoniobacter sp.]|uniref:OmpA family protein n=1 Tax=Chthoniobacter sp. TaxID=2510640 RepID=UPI0032AB1C2F
MAQYESFQSNAAEFPIMRKWLLRALVISLLIHAALLLFFNFKKLENFGNSDTAQLAPPMHVMRQVKIPELQDQDTKLVLPDKVQPKQIALPKDAPTLEDVIVTPAAPEATAPLVQEKPKVDLSGFESLEKNQGNSLAALEKQLSGVAGSIMDKSMRSATQPRIVLPANPRLGDGGSGSSGGIPGRATLDDALGKVGGPIANRAIAMRGGALFEWGKAELLPNAIQDLQKLGQLIKRNPKATFIISGHTDHTGTHDTNLILSQQRADSVRDWLVANLGLDPMRITSVGKADDEAFPDLGPDKSIDEQAPNRRVEIVIRTHGK